MQYCSKCGTSFEGIFCPKCGMPTANVILENERKDGLTNQPWFAVVMLFVFFPVGVYLLWRRQMLGNALRGILTFVAGIIFLGSLCCVVDTLVDDDGDNNGDNIVSSFRESKYVRMVKSSCPKLYEDDDITYGEAFYDYFSDPEWEHFVSTEGKDVVEFTGGCTYDGEPVDIKIQFIIDNDDDSFKPDYMEIDGDAQSDSDMNDVLMTVFDDELDD